MNVNEKLVQAKGMESNVQLIAMLLLKLLAADEALAKGFTRDAFTWEEMEKYVNDKALSARNEKKPHAKVMCISPETVMGWVKEFFLLDELPKKPEIPKYVPPKAVVKKEPDDPVKNKRSVAHKENAVDPSQMNLTPPVEKSGEASLSATAEEMSECELPVCINEGEDDEDNDATAALKKQISLFEMT
jgi:hypothetical protein